LSAGTLADRKTGDQLPPAGIYNEITLFCSSHDEGVRLRWNPVQVRNGTRRCKRRGTATMSLSLKARILPGRVGKTAALMTRKSEDMQKRKQKGHRCPGTGAGVFFVRKK